MSKRTVPSEPPARQNRVRTVAELLPDVGGAAFRKFGFVQSSIVSRWGEIVGEKLAAVSSPGSIRFPHGKRDGGTLSLTVRGAHAAMMAHVTEEITERVNRFFGYAAVARVTIRQGEVTKDTQRRAPPPGVSGLKPAPVELGASLKSIADPELRQVLEALASGVAARPKLPVVR